MKKITLLLIILTMGFCLNLYAEKKEKSINFLLNHYNENFKPVKKKKSIKLRGVSKSGKDFTDLSETEATKRIASIIGDTLTTLDLIDDKIMVERNQESIDFLMNELRRLLVLSEESQEKILKITEMKNSKKMDTMYVRDFIDSLIKKEIKKKYSDSLMHILNKAGFWYYTLSIQYAAKMRDFSKLKIGDEIVGDLKDKYCMDIGKSYNELYGKIEKEKLEKKTDSIDIFAAKQITSDFMPGFGDNTINKFNDRTVITFPDNPSLFPDNSNINKFGQFNYNDFLDPDMSLGKSKQKASLTEPIISYPNTQETINNWSADKIEDYNELKNDFNKIELNNGIQIIPEGGIQSDGTVKWGIGIKIPFKKRRKK